MKTFIYSVFSLHCRKKTVFVFVFVCLSVSFKHSYLLSRDAILRYECQRLVVLQQSDDMVLLWMFNFIWYDMILSNVQCDLNALKLSCHLYPEF